jgi:hypothetical protein
MKKMPIHNEYSPWALIQRIVERGPTYKEWFGIVTTEFFSGAPSAQELRLGEPANVPSTTVDERHLTAHGEELLTGCASKIAGSKSYRAHAIEKRLYKLVALIASSAAPIRANHARLGLRLSWKTANKDLQVLFTSGLLIHADNTGYKLTRDKSLVAK